MKMATDPQFATSIFGSVPQDIGYTDKGLDVTLAPGAGSKTDSLSRLGAQAEALLGLPTTVKVATTPSVPLEEGFQSASVSVSPWGGGAHIDGIKGNSGKPCTSGFNWQKWTTLELMGSTAEHCYQLLPGPDTLVQHW